MLRKIQKAYDGWRSIYGKKYQKIRFFVTESDKGSASITRQFVNFHKLGYNIATKKTLIYFLKFMDDLIKGGNKDIIPMNGAW